MGLPRIANWKGTKMRNRKFKVLVELKPRQTVKYIYEGMTAPQVTFGDGKVANILSQIKPHHTTEYIYADEK